VYTARELTSKNFDGEFELGLKSKKLQTIFKFIANSTSAFVKHVPFSVESQQQFETWFHAILDFFGKLIVDLLLCLSRF
jgi:hypothetical protein